MVKKCSRLDGSMATMGDSLIKMLYSLQIKILCLGFEISVEANPEQFWVGSSTPECSGILVPSTMR